MLAKVLEWFLAGNIFLFFLVVLFLVNSIKAKIMIVILAALNSCFFLLCFLDYSAWPALTSLIFFAICFLVSLLTSIAGLISKMRSDHYLMIRGLILAAVFNSFAGILWLKETNSINTIGVFILFPAAIFLLLKTLILIRDK